MPTIRTHVIEPLRRCFSTLACALAVLIAAAPSAATAQADRDATIAQETGTVGTSGVTGATDTRTGPDTFRLNQPQTDRTAPPRLPPTEPVVKVPKYLPTDFEVYVQSQTGMAEGREIRRFGSNLLTDPALVSYGQDPLSTVPADYIIKPGDEIALTIWGSVDADLRLTVDRAGRIAVPRLGAIPVAGLRNADLGPTITRRASQVFRNFELSATLGQLRAVRVFVAGYAQRPGSVVLGGLSSVLHAIMRAGGPSAAGSFRDIHLRRAGKEVATFDLYDLLLKGDHATDLVVQPDDVIFIGPVGPQVAVVGSVNQPAIFELKPGETLQDVIQMAGGFTAVADRSRVAIERLADRNSGRVVQVTLPQGGNDPLSTGELVRAFSAIDAALPKDRQNMRIHIEGEVAHPGHYVLKPGSTIADAVAVAGGMTPAAYPFGTEFTRISVRETQEANYERALRDLETDMVKNQASQRTTTPDEATAQESAATANARFLDRLRQVRPTGRVVLQIRPEDTRLPDVALEDGDRLKIPTRGTSVGVFGSVFNASSFLFQPDRTTQDYLNLAGGPTKGADRKSIFMVRADGTVISALQTASFWRSGSEFLGTTVLPGDTLFVPEELNKTTFVQDAKDWTQILYQFGLGVAGIKTLGF